MLVTDTERFRTERLFARSWQIKDLPLAMELWGDPAVTALIDSRGKLSDAQVEEKLRAEIERERSHGVQYWAQWWVRRLRRATALGLYARRSEFRGWLPSRKVLLGYRPRNGSGARRARIFLA